MMTFGTKPQKNDNPSSVGLEGLTKEIYENLKPDFVDPAIKDIEDISEDSMSKEQKKEAKEKVIYHYKTLSFNISKAIINYLKNNMEIKGIKCKLDNPAVTATVSPGIITTCASGPGVTSSPGTATGQVTTPTASQTNNGTGLVF